MQKFKFKASNASSFAMRAINTSKSFISEINISTNIDILILKKLTKINT